MTDAWMSPNGQAFIAMTMHFEVNGVAKTLLLDIMECACLHTGNNLAAMFAKVLEDFSISDKVRSKKG